MSSPTPTAIAWSAGLFEGEGSFTFTRGAAKGVSVQMTDKDVLVELRSLWGGHLYDCRPQNAGHKRSWKWALTSTQAEAFVAAVLPYLKVRRAKRATEWLAARRQAEARRAEIQEIQQKMIDLVVKKGLTHKRVAELFGFDRSYVTSLVKRSKLG